MEKNIGPEEVARLCFPLLGRANLTPDYGEALYAGLSRINQSVHESSQLRISPIVGATVLGNSMVLSSSTCNEFMIQTPLTDLSPLLKLAGKSINLCGNLLRIGIPRIEALQPSETLIARMITVKGKESEDQLTEFLMREMERKYQARLGEDYQLHILRRRVMRLHHRRIVGFGLAITDIQSEQLSLQLQALPPAPSRARYGCGFLHPGVFDSTMRNERLLILHSQAYQ